ncbi:MAG: CHC2 zinc finger domain-containing protein [Armatimonadota bacterium]
MATTRTTDNTDTLKLHIQSDPYRFYSALLPDLARDGGARWQARCPLHGDGNPSLKVFAKDGGWQCYGSNQGGDFFAFVQALRGCSFPAAVDEVKQLVGTPDTRPQAKPKATPAPAPIPVPLATVEACHAALLASGQPLAWLQEKKGLTLDIILRAKIGLSSDHWRETRYTIPSPGDRDDSFPDLRGYRPGGDPKVLPWSTGRGNRVFPWPWVSAGRRFIVCEGEVDCLGLLGRGVYAITSHNGVDGLLSDRLEWPDLTGLEFTVLGDADEAGDRLRDELPARLYAQGAAKVTKARWPADSPKGYDVADFLATGPTDAELWEVLHGGS